MAALFAMNCYPKAASFAIRSVIAAIAVVCAYLGPPALLFAVPVAFAILGRRMIACVSLAAIASAGLLYPHVQSLDGAVLSMPVASFSFIFIPALAGSIATAAWFGWQSWLALAAFVISVALIVAAGSSDWFPPYILSSEFFRTSVVLIGAVTVLFAKPFLDERSSEKRAKWIFAGAVPGLVFALFIPMTPIETVTFDESHGRWETVRATFTENDFGRSVNYTYSLLAKYAGKLKSGVSTYDAELESLPPLSSLLVVKMPTTRLSAQFSDKLETWIRGGGRLLVIADHTDLFDTTQILNGFLARFEVEIRPDAVFDWRGMPNVPTTPSSALLFGRIDAYGKPMAWQTGASLARMPISAMTLSSFGLSYSEPGDYSRPNRFGPFFPRPTLRLINHSSAIAFTAGSGAVAILLDSTPWSNFSIFKESYTRLFRGLLHALSLPFILKLGGWSSVALTAILLLLIVSRARIVMILAGLFLSLALGSGVRIGIGSTLDPVPERDFTLRVVPGVSAQFEFLKQLVSPGNRNYSRIVSAMAKYDLMPAAIAPGEKPGPLHSASQWLFIEPTESQLPSTKDVVAHLRSGKNIAVLFSPQQAGSIYVQSWISGLGLSLQKSIALTTAEDARSNNDDFLSRRGPAIIRDVRPTTVSLPTSILRPQESDQFFQIYSARPTTFPPSSGILIVSFSADQFSDDAVGDVWEGVAPSSIGMLRERQLANALLGKGLTDPFPSGLLPTLPNQEGNEHIKSYAILEDGKVIVSGNLANKGPSSPDLPSPLMDPAAYAEDLKRRAIQFIRSSCPRIDRHTRCKKRLLGADMLEWMVLWTEGEDSQISAIELLHERRFSGLQKTINVVFAE